MSTDGKFQPNNTSSGDTTQVTHTISCFCHLSMFHKCDRPPTDGPWLHSQIELNTEPSNQVDSFGAKGTGHLDIYNLFGFCSQPVHPATDQRLTDGPKTED